MEEQGSFLETIFANVSQTQLCPDSSQDRATSISPCSTFYPILLPWHSQAWIHLKSKCSLFKTKIIPFSPSNFLALHLKCSMFFNDYFVYAILCCSPTRPQSHVLLYLWCLVLPFPLTEIQLLMTHIASSPGALMAPFPSLPFPSVAFLTCYRVCS